MMHELAKGRDVAAWERAARISMALGTKLRLTPQSTIDPHTAGRRKVDLPRSPKYWGSDDE
jgi:hypothetical protein